MKILNRKNELVDYDSEKLFAGIAKASLGTKEEKLVNAIETGLKVEATNYTRELINDGYNTMDLVNNILIPALDKAGTQFEQGKILLWLFPNPRLA